jgi:hypothetical protein
VSQHSTAVNSNIFGNVFPDPAVSGQIYYHTDYGEVFKYEIDLNSWLGQQREMYFGNNSTSINNAFFRGVASIPHAATTYGYTMPFDFRVDGITSKWTTAITGGLFELQREGTNIVVFDLAQASSTRFNRDGITGQKFSAEGNISLYMNGLDAAIARPTATIFFRREEAGGDV